MKETTLTQNQKKVAEYMHGNHVNYLLSMATNVSSMRKKCRANFEKMVNTYTVDRVIDIAQHAISVSQVEWEQKNHKWTASSWTEFQSVCKSVIDENADKYTESYVREHFFMSIDRFKTEKVYKVYLIVSGRHHQKGIVAYR